MPNPTPNTATATATTTAQVSAVVNQCAYKKPADAKPTNVLSFSHFRRRRELRVTFSATAILLVGREPFNLTVKDLSLSGMWLQSEQPIEALEGVNQVRVAIPILNEEAGLEIHHWLYQVIRHFPSKGSYTILLKRLDGSEPELKVLQGWIEQMAAKQVEMTDEVLTLTALIYEKIYTQSLLDIPFVIEEHDGASHIPVVFKPFVSSISFEILSAEGRYNLSVFTSRDRVNAMRALESTRYDNIYLVLYRSQEDTTIKSAMNHQFDSNKQWQQFLSYASGFTFMRIFEVMRAPLTQMAHEKLTLRMAPILNKSAELGEKLQAEIKHIASVGLLVDTTELYRLPKQRYLQHPKPEIENQSDAPLPTPELIPFGVTPQRKEPRFNIRIPLQVKLRGHTFEATTLDISPSGIAIQIDKVLKGIEPDDEILISFISLFTKKLFSTSEWEKVGYRVIRGIHKNGTLIFVRIDPAKQWRQVPARLLAVLNKSAGEDAIDLRDEVLISRSNYLQSLVAENSPVVPFFFRKWGEGIVLDLVAKTNTNTRIWNFFETPGGHNFSPLFPENRTEHLSREARLSVTKVATMVIYIFKTKGGAYFSATAFELSKMKYSDTFLKLMHQQEYLVIKVVAQTAYQPTIDEIGSLATALQRISGKELKEVRTRIGRVAVSGYLINITDSYRSLQLALPGTKSKG